MTERHEDIWQAARTAQAVCITTNGSIKGNGSAVLGAGVALEAKTRWPNLPHLLGQWLQTTGGAGPHVFIIPANTWRGQPFVLVCVPVKHRWDEPADLTLIDQSLRELIDSADIYNWQRVVLPRPGCGNGGLTWEVVEPLCRQLDDRFLVVYK